MPTQRHATLLAALRQNLSLLQDLAARYEVGLAPGAGLDPRPCISVPGDAGALLAPEMRGLAQEHLRVLLLDSRNQALGQRVVYLGNVSTILVRPAEVFREAVLANAPRIILAHNHPSGDADPSPDDIQMTAQLLQAGKLLGIDLLDHLVVGRNTTTSLRARGLPTGVTWPV